MTQSSLQKIFSGYLKGAKLFVSKDPLAASYDPSTITHRDKQMDTVAGILAPCLRNEKPSNTFVYGKTGTGKTLCVKHVVNELAKTASDNNIQIKAVFINCKMKKVADTEYRVLAQLCKEFGYAVPATGLPTNRLYEIFYESLDAQKQNVLLVLDEIDALVSKVGDNILYNLTRVNQDLANAKLTLIGVTNDLSFSETLDPRVKSSLNEEEIVFPPYNAIELRDILNDRARAAFAAGGVKEGVIQKCAALAAQEHGDARRALDLLRVAGEIAERNGQQFLEESHVDRAQEKINVDRVLETVRMQPRQSQAILWSIANDQSQNLTTGETYEKYKEVCKKRGLEVLGPRRASDLISELGMLGILSVRTTSKGRHGRTKEISLLVSKHTQENIIEMLKKDFYFE
ncbi:MAG: orc1/cdc6 family replication initiation protein [Candidatus Aenigmarchaeota archaeon]|nr:orc1/cdc6 family replication initiation protein [Candidatus Aenigmarchaeota archaeon]